MLKPEFDYDTWAINATIYDCIPQYSIFDLFAELDIAGKQKGKNKKVSTPKPIPTVPNEPKGCTNARALIGRALDKAFTNAVKRATSKSERKEMQAAKELSELAPDLEAIVPAAIRDSQATRPEDTDK